MSFHTKPFSIAYPSYYQTVKNNLKSGISVLEIGGGQHPSITSFKHLDYTIIDPDLGDLNRAPSEIQKINSSIQDYAGTKRFDLIISKMVLEHIPDPDVFHRKVLDLLKPDGKAIHFFACRHSIPALVNRWLPEKVGETILRMLKNRDTRLSPKYPAFYKRTKGHTKSQLNYFVEMGYTIEKYYSFPGHKYFRTIPILNLLEQLYSYLLVSFGLKTLATVALVELKK